jgi:hypothetical protein
MSVVTVLLRVGSGPSGGSAPSRDAPPAEPAGEPPDAAADVEPAGLAPEPGFEAFGLALGDGDADLLGLGLPLADGDGDLLGLGLPLAEGDGDLLGLGLALGDGDADWLGLGLAVGDADWLGLGLAVGDADWLGLGLAVGDADWLGLGLALAGGDWAGVPVGVGVGVGDGDAEGDAVVADGEAVADDVAEPEALAPPLAGAGAGAGAGGEGDGVTTLASAGSAGPADSPQARTPPASRPATTVRLYAKHMRIAHSALRVRIDVTPSGTDRFPPRSPEPTRCDEGHTPAPGKGRRARQFKTNAHDRPRPR